MHTQNAPTQRRAHRRRVPLIVATSLAVAATASAALGLASHASTERQCAAARAADRAVASAAEGQLAKVEPVLQRMVDTVDPETGARYLDHPGSLNRASGREHLTAITRAQGAAMSFDHDRCASAQEARNIAHWASDRRASTGDLQIALLGAQRDLDAFHGDHNSQEAAR